MIALVTDSNSQLPDELRDRYGIRVVPQTVVVDGVDYQEGIDLDPAFFDSRLREHASISTAAPSPGQLLLAYEESATAGAEAILSIHVGAELSATLDAARLAARSSPVPVRVVDSTTASFALGCCIWTAAEALLEGAGLEDAAAAAQRTAAEVGNVFVVSSLEAARRGGRLESGAEAEGIPVLALDRGRMRTLASVTSTEEALHAMISYVEAATRDDRDVRVGVGDTDNPEIAGPLAAGLGELRSVGEVVRYHVGPSVAAHTGPDTVGAVFARR